jgi:hypothetical protein
VEICQVLIYQLVPGGSVEIHMHHFIPKMVIVSTCDSGEYMSYIAIEKLRGIFKWTSKAENAC